MFKLNDMFKFVFGVEHALMVEWHSLGRPRISTAAFHARIRGSVPGLGGLKETKCFFPIHS